MNIETVNLLAKRLAPDLSCQSCKALGLRTDGLSKGRLRLICPGCRRSSYADSHPRVHAEFLAQNEHHPLTRSPSKPVAPFTTSPSATNVRNSQVRKQSLSHHEDYINKSHVPKSTTSHHVDYMNQPNIENHSLHDDIEHFPTLHSSPRHQGSQHAPSHKSDLSHMDSSEESDEDQMMRDYMGPEAMRTLEFAEELTFVSCEVEEIKKSLNENKKAIHSLATSNKQSTTEISNLKNMMLLILEKIESLSKQSTLNIPVRHHQTTVHDVADFDTSSMIVSHDMSPTSLHLSQTRPPVSSKPSETWSDVAKRRSIRHPLMNTATNKPMTEDNRFRLFANSIPSYAKYDNVASFEASKQTKIKKLSKEEMKNIKGGKPARSTSPMVFLHFKGFKRNRICDVKSFLYSLAIPLYCIRNISFIGKSVMEITTFQDMKDFIISKLQEEDVVYIPDFDPLATSNLKDTVKFGNLQDDHAKSETSQKLYLRRLTLTLERLPKTTRNTRLRNFYESIIHNLNNNQESSHVPNLSTSTPIQKKNRDDIIHISNQHDEETMSTTSSSDVEMPMTQIDVDNMSTPIHVANLITSPDHIMSTLNTKKRNINAMHLSKDNFRKNLAQDPDISLSDTSSYDEE